MLRHLMEAKGSLAGATEPGHGRTQSTISEILAGKKRFSRQLIGKFADYFEVDASVLATNY